METVTLTKDEARTLHTEGNESTKQLIEKKCPDLFKPQYERVWEKFLAEHKRDIKLPFPGTRDREEQRTNAHHMLIHIVPAERGDWEPNYDDSNPKYEPVFRMDSSGFGLSLYVNDSWYALSRSGSRLCTPSSSECRRIAEKYLAVYERLLTK